MKHETQLGESLMPKKHHAIYSDPTGAAAAASPQKRRAPRTKQAVDGKVTAVSGNVVRQALTVDRAAVARLAYSYWEARGFTGGSPEDDWLRAERELRENEAATATA